MLSDTSTPEFAAEAERQARLVAASPQDADDQAFLDSVSVFFDDDAH
ncbi:antitoxin MazE-like protein [Enterovirga aerilata]|nr:antitoxin MazE-like protein [Enterovirga sp. DB1703]